MAVSIILFLFGAIMIAVGILLRVKPDVGWGSQRWMYKDFDEEPSDVFISWRKFGGIIVICVGVLFWIFGFLMLMQSIYG